MRWIRPKWFLKRVFHVFFLSILIILFVVAACVYLYSWLPTVNTSNAVGQFQPFQLVALLDAPPSYISSKSVAPVFDSPRSQFYTYRQSPLEINDKKCTIFSCFDIYRCGKHGNDSLTVYVYPIKKIFVDGHPLDQELSKEFYEFIHAIRHSPYYVPNPNLACLFVPTIDLAYALRSNSPDTVKLALQNLPFWGRNGENHLLISTFPETVPVSSLATAAMVVSSDFSPGTYRPGFDVSILTASLANNDIVFSDSVGAPKFAAHHLPGRSILAVSAQGSFSPSDPEILVLDFCHHIPFNYSIRCSEEGRVFGYPEILTVVDYCLVTKGMMQPLLWDIMRLNCIPVIVMDLEALPFSSLVDWRRVAVLIRENQIKQLSTLLRSISSEKKRKLRSQIKLVFQTYFASAERIMKGVFDTLHSRLFAHRMAMQPQGEQLLSLKSPLFNPLGTSANDGFTAVVLAYNRIPSLMQVIERVAVAPSLKKILVVWNNQDMEPPGALLWPKISKPLRIVQTSANKMSNRFYPYAEIETEAIFALDDDIVMLTADEIEFGYQSWREFPDRLVGYPSRCHVWDNSTSRWKYESEWTNQISMVLTGAAFYHKFWHHAYTYIMPASIREWVDRKMNCEDIAMNFLVADFTGQPPIKVAPKKKFKCPTCPVNEMLSTDTGHMSERTECINTFARIYGHMPLLPAEFRADPVLFKVEGLPRKIRKYSNIGSL